MDTAVLQPPRMNPMAEKPQSYLKILPPSGWSALKLHEVWQFRDLLVALAGRDIKVRYKQTALGVIWVVLQPLLAAAIFSFVFGAVAQLPTEGIPALLFMFVGLLGWNLFSGTLNKTSACLVGNSQLISKIFFPRLVLPFSSIASVLLDFTVAAGMLVVLMILYRWPPSICVLLVPVWIAMLLMTAMGVGLIAAALTVSYRDVQYVLPFVIQIMTYASPVFYSYRTAIKHIPEHFRFVYFLNPLVGPLEAFRVSILGGPWPMQLTFAVMYSAVMSVAVLLVGAYSFKTMERRFADVI